jgi:HAD superfamily hydrolase (TIGR01484 family)
VFLIRFSPKLKYIFSDFDGTLTDLNGLGPIFFEILDLIKQQQAQLVIVSGRSLSWGHFLLTHFPIRTAIMEGGGVILTRDEQGHILEHLMVSESEVKKLEETTQELKQLLPQSVLSVDSFGRKTDRAIEFKDMAPVDVERAEKFLKQKGLNYSISNVHLNFWCGDVSKYKGVKHFLDHMVMASEDEGIFFGDAPNDESMFQHFKNSVGVSNIQESISRIKHRPTTILQGEENRSAYGVFNTLKRVFGQVE